MLTNQIHYPLLGQLLHGRYQIIQVLSSGAFGQTYIAQDIAQPHKPNCVVKHHRLLYDYPNLLKTSKRILVSEAQMLEKLGSHEQIPQLLACFEENQWLCLVQELIEGQTLSHILPIKREQDRVWQQEEVVDFLQDLLTVLQFVHSQEIIHCDLKPNNIIKRSQDGKYILIDFGSAQHLRQYLHGTLPTSPSTSTIPTLGYLAPEQLAGTTSPSSDIYALGMMAIQALTGLEPSQLPQNWETGAIDWQKLLQDQAFAGDISEELITIIMKMTESDPEVRYQSTTEVMQALKEELTTQSEAIAVLAEIQQSLAQQQVEANNAISTQNVNTATVEKLEVSKSPSEIDKLTSSELMDYGVELIESAFSHISRLPMLMKGMGLGMAVTNLIAISFGVYSLVSTMAAVPELDNLRYASQMYHQGNLFEALSIAESISDESPLYEESRTALRVWQQQWEQAETQFATTQQAFRQQQWFDVLEQGKKVPKIEYWQDQVAPMLEKAHYETEVVAEQSLKKAFQAARKREFNLALYHLEQIHPRTKIGRTIKPKLAEYQQKKEVRATYLLQQAYNLAEKRQFKQAIVYLERIPSQTKAGEVVPQKIAEYQEKQKIRAAYEENLRLTVQNQVVEGEQLNPGDQLREIPLEPQLFAPVNWY